MILNGSGKRWCRSLGWLRKSRFKITKWSPRSKNKRRCTTKPCQKWSAKTICFRLRCHISPKRRLRAWVSTNRPCSKWGSTRREESRKLFSIRMMSRRCSVSQGWLKRSRRRSLHLPTRSQRSMFWPVCQTAQALVIAPIPASTTISLLDPVLSNHKRSLLNLLWISLKVIKLEFQIDKPSQQAIHICLL